MATDIAAICRDIVLKSSMTIQNRKYVRCEGWQSIATAHGCTASARNVERVEGGYRAIGEIRRMNDGAIIAEAEGFVGEDEPTWFGGETEVWNKTTRQREKKILPKRPDYAIRAMAQTRAISRACRTAFAHVVVLMDAGLATTPAEEVPAGGFDNDQHVEDRVAEREQASEAAATVGNWRDTEVHFGKNKGKKLSELSAKTVEWYRDAMVERRDDPAPKYPMGKDDRRLLAACEMALLELQPKAGEKPATGRTAPPKANPHETLRSMLSFNNASEDDLIAACHKNGMQSDVGDIASMNDQEAQSAIENFEKLTGGAK